jgi:hypothetical protein
MGAARSQSGAISVRVINIKPGATAAPPPRAQRSKSFLRRFFLKKRLLTYRPNADLSDGTRSVFSQVNVPSSASGVRPKWPKAEVGT